MSRSLSSAQVIALGFATFILFGALLLTLPVMHTSGEWLNFRDALFTSTSAVCVTGLVVVDTGTFYSTMGQVVILGLIQVGGLGIVTVATLLLIGLGRHLPYSQRNLVTENFSVESTGGILKLVLRVFKTTVIIEGLGALVLALAWREELGWGKAAYFGAFHAISAFCNAGFDLFGGFKSLTDYVGSIPVNGAMTTLIILGGIGFPVITDVLRRLRRQTTHLQLHSQVVITMTIGLIVFGFVMFFLLESGGVMQGLSPLQKVLASYFQAVTPRTAGYNTVDMRHLSTATILLISSLMFVGASPISTGGGIKTSTFALLLLTTRTVMRGEDEIRVGRKSIDKGLVMKALALMMIAFALVFVVALLVQFFEPVAYERILFEVVSAFGTVGLSTGLTPSLSGPSRFLLILVMYIGRIGPLTFGFAFIERRRKSSVKLPEGRVYIG